MSAAQTLEEIKRMTHVLDELDEFYASDKEREVELLANALTDMVLILDQDGVVKYANPSSFRVLGYDPTELVGRNISCIVGEAHNIAASVKTTLEMVVPNKHGEEQRIVIYFGELKDIGLHLYIVIIKKVQTK